MVEQVRSQTPNHSQPIALRGRHISPGRATSRCPSQPGKGTWGAKTPPPLANLQQNSPWLKNPPLPAFSKAAASVQDAEGRSPYPRRVRDVAALAILDPQKRPSKLPRARFLLPAPLQLGWVSALGWERRRISPRGFIEGRCLYLWQLQWGSPTGTEHRRPLRAQGGPCRGQRVVGARRGAWGRLPSCSLQQCFTYLGACSVLTAQGKPAHGELGGLGGIGGAAHPNPLVFAKMMVSS